MNSYKTILLVDDDLDDQMIFIQAAEAVDKKIKCLTANDVESGLDVLNNAKTQLPDYIFLDLNMPKLDGKQFLVRMKEIDRFASIPVIIYSTTRQQKDVEETSRLGAVGFFTKPIFFKDICEAIRFVVDNKWMDHEMPNFSDATQGKRS